ncbi:hypothetical protein GZ77_14685 [Endozoicomonas montiporae]|uniref:Uncharacterized protein n=2 Tax=Endozoicomonas montiporae TaxID=1027273 RepID=A0A081N546_9GAMM|nr:hypothetical protein [Endozoicomonas montiporae]KEQ13569.1 hypothetical protein GZ77_14685 [Endozoicomonas montiporae]
MRSVRTVTVLALLSAAHYFFNRNRDSAPRNEAVTERHVRPATNAASSTRGGVHRRGDPDRPRDTGEQRPGVVDSRGVLSRGSRSSASALQQDYRSDHGQGRRLNDGNGPARAEVRRPANTANSTRGGVYSWGDPGRPRNIDDQRPGYVDTSGILSRGPRSSPSASQQNFRSDPGQLIRANVINEAARAGEIQSRVKEVLRDHIRNTLRLTVNEQQLNLLAVIYSGKVIDHCARLGRSLFDVPDFIDMRISGYITRMVVSRDELQDALNR